MERNHFNLGEKKSLIWKGQQWTLSDKSHANVLPNHIEIVDIVNVKEATEKILKCKIREIKDRDFAGRLAGFILAPKINPDEVTQFMLAGDILTYYEQV